MQMCTYTIEDRMGVIVLLRKQTGISQIFETFHCLTWLCMFLKHQKNTVYFVKERNSNTLGQGRKAKQAKGAVF